MNKKEFGDEMGSCGCVGEWEAKGRGGKAEMGAGGEMQMLRASN